MEFGAFEDDLFDDDEDSKKDRPTTNHPDAYVPKKEYAGWFLDDDSNGGGDRSKKKSELNERDRMRANFHYYRGEYEKAAGIYEELMRRIPIGSSQMRLEFMECLARSLAARDPHDPRAERIGLDFYEKAINYDQQLQALNLLSDVYWMRGDDERCAVTCGACISMMDGAGNADLWYRLARCFDRWKSSSNGGGSSSDSEVCGSISSTGACSSPDGDPIDSRQPSAMIAGLLSSESDRSKLVAKCLGRAHEFYASTYATSIGYAKERNEIMRRQIEQELKLIGFDTVEKYRYSVKEKMGKDEDAEEVQSGDGGGAGKNESDKMLDGDLETIFKNFMKLLI